MRWRGFAAGPMWSNPWSRVHDEEVAVWVDEKHEEAILGTWPYLKALLGEVQRQNPCPRGLGWSWIPGKVSRLLLFHIPSAGVSEAHGCGPARRIMREAASAHGFCRPQGYDYVWEINPGLSRLQITESREHSMLKPFIIFLIQDTRLTQGSCHFILTSCLVLCDWERRHDPHSWDSKMLGQFAGTHFFVYRGVAYRLSS